MIFDRYANLKYKYGNRFFGVVVILQIWWEEMKMQKKYIQNQLKEYYEYDQMTLKEYIDPFTGSKN